MKRKAPRRIAFIVYDGIQSLDLAGPLEVFAMANWQCAANDGRAPVPYEIEILAREAGAIRASSGLQLMATRAYATCHVPIDTLIVAGGEVYDAARDPHLRRWLQRCAPKLRRLASVCSGAFVLAEAGLLNGRRATTHWSAVHLLAAYPQITVEPDAIFVRDGSVYTSAGITAGIDLALALVEEDLGHKIALAIARRLVVFLKRPGGQSQFSGHLAAQTQPAGILKDLPEWIVEHLGDDLAVEALAQRLGMSPRNFARTFAKEMGLTPAKFVEKARLDEARRLLEDSTLGLEEVANRCGFSCGEQMRRTFHRHLKIIPFDYRRRFQQRPQAAIGSTASTSTVGDTHHGRANDKETRRRSLPGLRVARRIRAA